MTKDEQIKFLREALEIVAGRRQCIDNLLSHAEIAQQALAAVEAPPPADKYSDMISGAFKAYEELAPELKNAHDREQRRSFLRGMCPSHWDYESWCRHVDKWCDENGY